MRPHPPSSAAPRPLVLGASGRIGHGFQHLAQAGVWPGPLPLWQVRPGPAQQQPQPQPQHDSLFWDILQSPPPDPGPLSAIFALAGPTRGDLSLTTDLALAAIDMALQYGPCPVLIASSSAVYGPQAGAAAEDAVPAPVSAYGQAKLAMEQAVLARLGSLGQCAPPLCLLRIGNVAGADAALLAAQHGAVTLDRFADGRGPRRSYVGMRDLAVVMTGLARIAALGQPLPQVLNIGGPWPVEMQALLQAAGVGWTWQTAPATAQHSMTLDTSRLGAVLPGIGLTCDPAALIRQSRLAGWHPA